MISFLSRFWNIFCRKSVWTCLDKSLLTLTDNGDNIHDADDQASVLMSATFKRHIPSIHTSH